MGHALMRLVPAAGPAGLDDERHQEFAMWLAGAFHHPLNDLCGVLDLGLGGLEQQLVMDLQEHTGAAVAREPRRQECEPLMSAAEPCKGALITRRRRGAPGWRRGWPG